MFDGGEVRMFVFGMEEGVSKESFEVEENNILGRFEVMMMW